MPRKSKTTAAADKAAQPQFSAELLEQLIPGQSRRPSSKAQQFKKPVLERVQGAEMCHQLGCAPSQTKPEGATSNHRKARAPRQY